MLTVRSFFVLVGTCHPAERGTADQMLTSRSLRRVNSPRAGIWTDLKEQFFHAPGMQPATSPGVDSLAAMFRLTLKEAVKDVRPSERLTGSAVCLVAHEGDMDTHLERMLAQCPLAHKRRPAVDMVCHSPL